MAVTVSRMLATLLTCQPKPLALMGLYRILDRSLVSAVMPAS
jgi:hypothetical protein